MHPMSDDYIKEYVAIWQYVSTYLLPNNFQPQNKGHLFMRQPVAPRTTVFIEMFVCFFSTLGFYILIESIYCHLHQMYKLH